MSMTVEKAIELLKYYRDIFNDPKGKWYEDIDKISEIKNGFFKENSVTHSCYFVYMNDFERYDDLMKNHEFAHIIGAVPDEFNNIFLIRHTGDQLDSSFGNIINCGLMFCG